MLGVRRDRLPLLADTRLADDRARLPVRLPGVRAPAGRVARMAAPRSPQTRGGGPVTPLDFTSPENARTGINVYAHRDGIEIDGWYDSIVGLGVPAFLTWEQLDEMRQGARRRKPYTVEAVAR